MPIENGRAISSPLAIAVLDANFLWTRQLFEPLAQKAPILFLQPKDFRTARHSKWPLSSLFRLKEEQPNLYVKRYAFPPGWFSKYPQPFSRYLAHEIRSWKRRMRAERLALVVTFPHYAPVARWAQASLTVYYWTDEFRVYWPGRREQVTRLELQAISSLDLTMCTSHTKAKLLRDELPNCAHKIDWMLLGHNPDLLPSTPTEQPKVQPSEFSHLPRPILGHWGQVSNHLDFNIVLKAATSLPYASFLFIGPVQENFDSSQKQAYETCRRLPNVYFVGARPYARMKDYLGSFDICLLLYRPDLEFTRVVHPGKLRDYMATAKPLVSTPLPDVVDLLSKLVSIGSTPEQYVAHIRYMIANGGDGKESDRWRWAKEHTWKKASEHMWNILSEPGITTKSNNVAADDKLLSHPVL